MKYLLYLPLLFLFHFSCKNEVLQAFEDQNKSTLDSINIYNTLSERLLEQIYDDNVKIKSEYAEFVYFSVLEQNAQIDSILILLEDKAVNRNDRTVSTRYLVKEGKADKLKKQCEKMVNQIERVDLFAMPVEAKRLLLENTEGNPENWATQKFKNMPMIVSVAILNKWKFNNSKANALILLKLKDKLLNNDITDQNTRRI